MLLLQVLRDPRFMEEAEPFGTRLIAKVLAQETIQEDFKQLVMKVLQD